MDSPSNFGLGTIFLYFLNHIFALIFQNDWAIPFEILVPYNGHLANGEKTSSYLGLGMGYKKSVKTTEIVFLRALK